MNGNLQLLNADLRAHLRKCFDDEVKAVRKAFRGSKGQISIPETYLSSLVERMGSSRIAFMTDAGQFLTLLIILLFAAAMIAAQVPATRGVWRWPLWIASEFMFGIVPIVAFALRDKAIAIYEFYVASVIHAAVVHAAFSLSHAHPWFAYVYRDLNGAEVKDVSPNGDPLHLNPQVIQKDWKQILVRTWTRTSSNVLNYETSPRIFQWLDQCLGASKGQLNLLRSFEKLLALACWIAVIAFVLNVVGLWLWWGPSPEIPEENNGWRALWRICVETAK